MYILFDLQVEYKHRIKFTNGAEIDIELRI